MSVAVAPVPKVEQPVEMPMYRFTVAQYHRMIEIGVLTGEDRVELIEGRIIHKMPHNAPHNSTVNRTSRRLDRLIPDDWTIRVQSAITLRDSQPEPDIAIVRGPDNLYDRQHPGPRDIEQLIEVSDATLRFDRTIKCSVYARARIPVYWIINLIESKIEVYTHPKSGRTPAYQQRREYGREESVPLVLDGAEICKLSVCELLPSA